MAKQTFTTGQVLTAAQMTSLQQTAMGGGSATAKTASYTLVAADAGTTVAMNAAGATTITVNTGLFAAGDTVFIQNLGAGACTVTAGTATVATAGSLILPQNDAGILYFTATGASIFYDYIQAGAVSPLTTKGDLYTFSTSDARLAVGTDTYTLVADSGEATGLKWAAPASGGGMTLINSGGTALSGQQITISSIPNTYKNLYIVVVAAVASGAANTSFRLNADTGNNYTYRATKNTTVIARDYGAGVDRGYIGLCTTSTGYNNIGRMRITIDRYADTAYKQVLSDVNFGDEWWSSSNSWDNTAAITSFTIFADSASGFTGGTIYVYGVN